MRIIIIRSMPDEWQQEFELNYAKSSDQSIRSVLAYFESQQSFKDQIKHLPKNSFQTITQNRLRIAEGNRVNEDVSRQFYNDKFTPNGRGRARAIVNAAGRKWDHLATVRHQALQASHMYHDHCGHCLVHPEVIHTWGNCFQNPSTQGGRAGCMMAGRHNGRGRSSFGGHGHFGGRGGGSHSNPMESYHTDTANPVPVPHARMLNAWVHNTHPFIFHLKWLWNYYCIVMLEEMRSVLMMVLPSALALPMIIL